MAPDDAANLPSPHRQVGEHDQTANGILRDSVRFFRRRDDHAGKGAERTATHRRQPHALCGRAVSWNGSTWNFVSRIGPGSWKPFPNAANGSVWRAVFASNVREHKVSYAWSSDYGGYQDVWLIN